MTMITLRQLLVVLVLWHAPAVHAGKVRLAVTMVQTSGMDSEHGPLLTEILTSEIDALGRFDVVSGSDIQATLGFEWDRELLGCTDAVCLAEIGGALGVEKLVVSHIGKLGGTYVVNIKVIDIAQVKSDKRVYESVRGELDSVLAAIRKSVRTLLAAPTPKASRLPPAPEPKRVVATVEKPRPPEDEPRDEKKEVARADTPPPASETVSTTDTDAGPIYLWRNGLVSVSGVALAAGIVFGVQANDCQDEAKDEDYVGVCPRPGGDW